jgi:hypothetical protein
MFGFASLVITPARHQVGFAITDGHDIRRAIRDGSVDCFVAIGDGTGNRYWP